MSAQILGAGIWKLLIAGLITLSVSIITLFVGFFAGQVLKAPNLDPQYADTIIETERYIIPTDILNKLNKNKKLVSALQSRINDISITIDGEALSCVSWLKDGDLLQECYIVILNISSEFSANISATRSEWASIKTSILDSSFKSSNIQLFIPPLMLEIREISRLIRENQPKKAIDAFERVLKKIDEDISSINILNKILEGYREHEPSRTGYVYINVGVLNDGESDGVVLPQAKLHFGDSILNFIASEYSVIKAHSFAEIQFQIDEENSPPTSVRKWQNLIRNDQQEQFQLDFSSAKKELSIIGRLPEGN